MGLYRYFGLGPVLAIAALTACSPAPAPLDTTPPAPITATAGIGSITRLSPAADAVIPEDAVIERLSPDLFTWSEGPVWVADVRAPLGGTLLFTDVPQATIYEYSRSADGADTVTAFLQPSGYVGPPDPTFGSEGANGLILGGDDTIIYGDHGSRALMQLRLSDKSKTVLADRYEGKRFNSPNDVVRHSSGALYFTDPPYGLKGFNDNPTKELPYSGVYRRAPDGSLSLLDQSLSFPNGIILSPDERTLYVTVSDPRAAKLYRYDLNAQGFPTARSEVFDFTPLVADAPGLPDGMAISADGHIFVTGPGGVHVFSPDGARIALIATGTAAANCTFGGADGRDLYITSHKFLARVSLSTRGLGL